jgi:hypothetical protein
MFPGEPPGSQNLYQSGHLVGRRDPIRTFVRTEALRPQHVTGADHTGERHSQFKINQLPGEAAGHQGGSGFH